MTKDLMVLRCMECGCEMAVTKPVYVDETLLVRARFDEAERAHKLDCGGPFERFTKVYE